VTGTFSAAVVTCGMLVLVRVCARRALRSPLTNTTSPLLALQPLPAYWQQLAALLATSAGLWGQDASKSGKLRVWQPTAALSLHFARL